MDQMPPPRTMATMFTPSDAVSTELFDFLFTSHRLGHSGFHGMDHWLRVLLNGRLLASETGANLRVVELFALLHDSCRENENDDPQHGHRAAAYARDLRGTWFEVTDAEMDLLTLACELHSDGHTDANITVQTCWDADRLDLGRVGIRPSARYLCTEVAKRADVLAPAYRRSTMYALKLSGSGPLTTAFVYSTKCSPSLLTPKESFSITIENEM
jgi:uncharacterized protein